MRVGCVFVHACVCMCACACRAPTLVNRKLKKNACFNCEQEREGDLHTVVTLFLNFKNL